MKSFTVLVRELVSGYLRFAVLILALLPAVASGQTPQATPPPPSEPRSVQFPKPVEKTLANGLRVIVIERAGTPLITAQLVIKKGGEVDPPELAGLGNMLADLITKGTEKRSATQIAEAIEALGGSLYSSARWDSTRVGIDVMSSKVDPAIDILADVVRRPTFTEDEIERLRQQTLDDLTVELGDPAAITRYVASRIIYWRRSLRSTTQRHTTNHRSDQSRGVPEASSPLVPAGQRNPDRRWRHQGAGRLCARRSLLWRLEEAV